MKITGRAAGRLLGDLGVDRESARRALLAGVAGPGERIGGLVLYESARVEELVARVGSDPEPDPRSIAPICRDGIFVARVGPRKQEASSGRAWKGADMTAPMSEQLDAVCRWWRMSLFTEIFFQARVERNGYLPLLATVSGFVVLGADIVGIAPHGREEIARALGSRSGPHYDRTMNPRQRRLVIPVALAGLILIVLIAALLK